MTVLQLKNVRLSFPAVFKPQAFGDGNPAYGAKLIVDPKSANVEAIRKAIEAEAKAKWGEKAKAVLDMIQEDKNSAWVEGPYRNKKSGDVWDGFEGNYFLSTRNEKLRPTALDRNKQPVTEADNVIYGGCYVDASVDIYAFDSPKWGRRINATLRGVRFVRDGDAFGGSSAASADEFEDLDDEDFV